jgi:hypothetical protein
MITKHKRIGGLVAATIAAAGLGAVTLAVPGEAIAQQNATKPYGCACLHNSKVDLKVSYRYRWGDKPWKTSSLTKGQTDTVCWTYKDAPKSPELEFQLDTDLTGKTNWETFSIPRAQSTAVQCKAVPDQAHYHFGYVKDSNKKKIQVYPGKS